MNATAAVCTCGHTEDLHLERGCTMTDCSCSRFRPVKANAVQVGGEHYKTLEIQPWDAIEAWGLGFLDGNVIKYVARWRKKNGVEDLKKARHYLDKVIEREESK